LHFAITSLSLPFKMTGWKIGVPTPRFTIFYSVQAHSPSSQSKRSLRVAFYGFCQILYGFFQIIFLIFASFVILMTSAANERSPVPALAASLLVFCGRFLPPPVNVLPRYHFLKKNILFFLFFLLIHYISRQSSGYMVEWPHRPPPSRWTLADSMARSPTVSSHVPFLS
jgi:hypothetical protein